MSVGEKKKIAKNPRWNKNKKKNWRSKIVLTKVEEALDNERLEIRTHGDLLKNKKDSQLFVIEKKGNDNVKGHKKYHRSKQQLNEVIPSSRRNAAKMRRRQERQLLISQLRKKIPKVQPKQKVYETNLDLWSQPADEIRENMLLSSNVLKHTKNVIGKSKIVRPKHLFSVPVADTEAVEVSHPGASYNPSFGEHQNLLYKENASEEKKVKAIAKIERATDFDPDNICTEESKEAELREGLFDEESDHEEEMDDRPEDVVINPPVSTNDRKTRRSKRKELEQKNEKVAKETEWAHKIRQNEVFRTKTFLSEINKKEKADRERRFRKSLIKKQPVLSSLKFVEPDKDLQLSTEIRGSLRQLKPEGDLMEDRYKSLQKRCIIEPRQKFKAPKRKYKLRFQEKRTFREITL